jgi:hypothetical protein
LFSGTKRTLLGPPLLQRRKAQYQAAALNMQKQAIQDAGAAALRLITTALTATADPGVGRNLDVAA